MDRVNPTLIQDYYVPAACGKRIYLRGKDYPEGDADPFLQTLAKLGEQHETRQRERLAPYLDLAFGTREDRIKKTRQALLEKSDQTLFRPLLAARTALGGKQRELVGEPDFLVQKENGWSVLEVKLARKVEGGQHREIRLQVDCYGWLLDQTLGEPPVSLQVLLGDGSISEREYTGAEEALELLDKLVLIREQPEHGYEPVGWSKCMPCAFRGLCFAEAKSRNEVSLVPELDQSLARELRAEGVRTVASLVKRFDEESLSRITRPLGPRRQRVGKKARRILLNANALDQRREIRLGALAVPPCDHYAMFDIEGIPPDLEDDIGRIFLWGLKVYGERPSGFLPAVAGFDADGDRRAWFEFLAIAARLFDEYGEDLPFVHWSHYEVTKLQSYVELHGDDDQGTAERLGHALFDLLGETKRTWALPLLSYSLKEVEKHVGYKRILPEANGAWAMAQYIEAVAGDDEKERQSLMDQICQYNEEDLDATWQVLVWLLEKESDRTPSRKKS